MTQPAEIDPIRDADPSDEERPLEDPHLVPDEGGEEPPPKRRLAGLLRGWGGQLLVVAVVLLAFVMGLSTGAPEHAEHAAAAGEKGVTWTCSMHPQIKLPNPGKCPICGMDLIPLDASTEAAPNRIIISERARTLARIRTTPVIRSDTSVELRLLGKLEFDETRVRTITPWTAGRIDKLFVANVGAKVKAGQVLASMYSPEVYAAQQDLLSAMRQRERLADALPIARRAADSAYQAAKTRLELLGFSAKSVVKGKKVARNVAVTALYPGTVTEQLVHEGAYVQTGQPLFRIADLSTLWVQLDAYEGDLPRIAVGQTVTLDIPSIPGESFEGVVAFVDPVVDPMTRTARVRVEVKNPDGKLRRGMFADAVIAAGQLQRGQTTMLVPRSAPLFTGKRSLVYVEVPGTENPTYEAREVTVGPLAGPYYPVLAGLKEGERVVVHGAFTLDSDLQIRAGKSMMTMPDDAERAAMSKVDMGADLRAALGAVLRAYLEVKAALAGDNVKDAKQAYAKLAKLLGDKQPRVAGKAGQVWRPLAARVRDHAERGAAAETITAARRSLEQVSLPLLVALRRFGNPLDDAVRVAECPMAIDRRTAPWIQLEDKVQNPYWGKEMIDCGAIKETVTPKEAPASAGPKSREAPRNPHAGHGGH